MAVTDVSRVCKVFKGVYYKPSLVSVIIKGDFVHSFLSVFCILRDSFFVCKALVLCMYICIYLQTCERIIMKPDEMRFYRKRTETLKALANPYRLWMVERLAEGELCVCEFNKALDLDYSTISRHLSVLRKAGIVEYRKSGKQVYYSLRTPCLLGFLSCFDEAIKMNIKQETEYISSRESV